ncbi:MBL fold metallo-hydrolase [Agaribacterium haliotis]|uniref:MBL fold metallo-hydrolase n=1 Tax=Agaribacterium haliotis TaxID=2013869 RepID=UPI000BB5902F|nr:MBL fold metallo-hydrolase [Agaribacterium haliotis]
MSLKFCTVPVTHYQQNCSIIWCELSKQAALVDPGGDANKLLGKIDELGLSLNKILLTHGHMDHVGATSEIRKSTAVPVIGPHKDDDFWLQSLAQQASMMGFEAQAPLEPDTWLNDGDTVELGELSLQVIHCPGHTPGHVVFYEADSQQAFVGDVLFAGSIGRTDFPKGNMTQLLDSIRNKLLVLGDEVNFVPGHGPNSSFGRERVSNPFLAEQPY